MNAYDFDETIYYGDSEFHFIEYIFKKYPLEMKKYARRYKFYRFLQKKLKLISRDKARVKIFTFLKVLRDVDKDLEEFRASHTKNIKKWYYDVKRPDDVIISATPSFILEPIAKTLGNSKRFTATLSPKSFIPTPLQILPWQITQMRRFSSQATNFRLGKADFKRIYGQKSTTIIIFL